MTTWNSSDRYGNPSRMTFSNGDLTVAATSGYWTGGLWQSVRGTTSKSGGKVVFQTSPDVLTNDMRTVTGLMTSGPNIQDDPGVYPGQTPTGIGYYGNDGSVYLNAVSIATLRRQGNSPIMVAADFDAALAWFAVSEALGSCFEPQATPIIISNNRMTVNIEGYAVGEWRGSRSITERSSGLLYCECTPSASSTTVFGLCNSAQSMTANNTIGQGGTEGVSYKSDGTTVNCGGVSMSAWGTNTIGMAVNLTTGNVWFQYPATGYWNGNASYDPAAGTGGINLATQTVSGPYYAAVKCYSADAQTMNFGASAFVHTVPSGFMAWDNPSVPTLWNGDVLANQNPATGVGGLDISGFGAAAFPAWSTFDLNTSTANFSGAPLFGVDVPFGFGSWDPQPSGWAGYRPGGMVMT